MAAAADRSEDPYGVGVEDEDVDEDARLRQASALKGTLLCAADLEKFNELHDSKGRFDFNTAKFHETGLKLKPTKQRAFEGKQIQTKLDISKHSAGALGENIVIAHLQANGLKDARPITLQRNNFAVDLVQDHGESENGAGECEPGRAAVAGDDRGAIKEGEGVVEDGERGREVRIQRASSPEHPCQKSRCGEAGGRSNEGKDDAGDNDDGPAESGHADG
jgi:hypothetical protein